MSHKFLIPCLFRVGGRGIGAGSGLTPYKLIVETIAGWFNQISMIGNLSPWVSIQETVQDNQMETNSNCGSWVNMGKQFES